MPYVVDCVDWVGTAADELGKTLRGTFYATLVETPLQQTLSTWLCVALLQHGASIACPHINLVISHELRHMV